MPGIPLLLLLFPFFGTVLYGQQKVCISIDDAPNTFLYQEDKFTSPFLSQLDSLKIPATIFINEGLIYKTDSVQRNFDLLVEWVRRDLFEIGNHTFAHSRYSEVGFDEFSADVKKGDYITAELCKYYDKPLNYFRFPYNDLGSDSSEHARIEQFLHTRDYQTAPFTVESSDWMFNYIYTYYLGNGEVDKAQEIGDVYVSKTMDQFAFFDSLSLELYGRVANQIYLCHDNRLNADHLHKIVGLLAAQNTQFVSMKEALSDPIYDQTDFYDKKWGVSWFYRWMPMHENRIKWMRQEPDFSAIENLYSELVRNSSNRAQGFTATRVGSEEDLVTKPEGGICLMGGGRESDEAMRWFLNRANGGDILVLRASGSDGYNEYLYRELGVSVNSVETVVFHDSLASLDSNIHRKIAAAEGIWFAGGDQWNYVSYWRDSSIDSLINQAINGRHIVVGGNSAGMAVQGGFYFAAEHGTITSKEALADPFDERMTIDSTAFLKNKYLSSVITDTHYTNRDRKGRHVAFLSRILTDYGVAARGIGCDEQIAVCIDELGSAQVFGPGAELAHAYFVQTDLDGKVALPELCTKGQSLTWHRARKAMKVYKVAGTERGSGSFDLRDWHSAHGGVWLDWWVKDGVFYESPTKD